MPGPPAAIACSIAMFSQMSTTANSTPSPKTTHLAPAGRRRHAPTAVTVSATAIGKITPAVLCTQFSWPRASSSMTAESARMWSCP